jgi:diguanylate cyclase (GGDEF)-like protein
MNTQENTPALLLELGNPVERRTRSGQLHHALRTALALTDGDAAVVLLAAGHRTERLVMYAGSPAPAAVPLAPEGSQVVRTLTECLEPISVADLSELTPLALADGCPGVEAGPVLFTALRQRDPQPGYLAVYRRRGRARFGTGEVRALLLLSAWLGTSLECLRLASGAEKLALRDELTDVYNARFLQGALRREVRRAGRFGQELSLALADVDHLGAFNEQHGELRGSILLRELATVLAEQVRSFDLIARYRRDEFMLVLPQTGRAGALEVAERVRGAVERHAFAPLAAGAITISLGVASFPQEGTDVRSVLSAVERAVTQAQQRGTNLVESLDRRAA